MKFFFYFKSSPPGDISQPDRPAQSAPSAPPARCWGESPSQWIARKIRSVHRRSIKAGTECAPTCATPRPASASASSWPNSHAHVGMLLDERTGEVDPAAQRVCVRSPREWQVAMPRKLFESYQVLLDIT